MVSLKGTIGPVQGSRPAYLKHGERGGGRLIELLTEGGVGGQYCPNVGEEDGGWGGRGGFEFFDLGLASMGT